MSASTAPSAFSPAQIGPLRLRNRFIKSATNEGKAKGGIVSKGLAQFHERIAAGGAALSTVAYCATSPDGRTFTDQAILNDDSLADFRVLTDGVHKHGGAASAQITHAGSFTFLDHDTLKTKRPLSSSGGFNKVGVMSGRYLKKAMSKDEMAAMTDEFVAAALLAKEAGFDAVELHMGHGYLLSQFISKLYNKRWDGYGGGIEKRMRFPNEVLARVLDAVGKDMAVIVKYSMTDGHKGNTITDGIAVAKSIEATGAHLAVLSNGLNVESISAMFGNGLPPAARGSAGNPVIALGMKLQAWMEPPATTFRESYLRENALQVRAAVRMPLAYIGGVQSLIAADQALADGFETIALGRALVHDPAFVNKLAEGSISRSGCTACNRCVTMMYGPAGTYCIEGEKHDASINTVRAAA